MSAVIKKVSFCQRFFITYQEGSVKQDTKSCFFFRKKKFGQNLMCCSTSNKVETFSAGQKKKKIILVLYENYPENVEDCFRLKDKRQKKKKDKKQSFFICSFSKAKTFCFYDNIQHVHLIAFYRCSPLNEQLRWLVNRRRKEKTFKKIYRL